MEFKTPEKQKKFDLLKILWSLWLLCVALFNIIAVYSYFAGSGALTGIVSQAGLQTGMLTVGLAGVITFGILIVAALYRVFLRYGFIRRKNSGPGETIGSYIGFTAILAIFPIYLFFRLMNFPRIAHHVQNRSLRTVPMSKVAGRLAGLVMVVGIILPVWIAGYYATGYVIADTLGFIQEPQAISGTGSMYPTFPKGEGKDQIALSKQVVGTPGMFRYPNGLLIIGKRFFGYQIGRGDIVVVENDQIRERIAKIYGEPGGWVKRIIGLPGDTIELRDGIVYLNEDPQREVYTATPRSTFGQSFLGECKKVTVPDDAVFLMGDNRKGSGDSRDMGFVGIRDINHVIPLKSQIGVLDHGWRDTTKDLDEASRIQIVKDEYLRLLNDKRREAGVKAVTYQPKLEVSAQKRGAVILKYDDFSFEATRSGYTMVSAMRDAGYSNIVWGEAPALGYYEAEELIENQFQFPESKEFLLDRTFQEIGIAEVQGSINGCPTQVIVQHFAGYTPPNYTADVVESWKLSLTRLQEIQPGWNKLKDVFSIYDAHKEEVNRMNEIIAIRINNIAGIVAKMEANQWLTPEQNRYIEMDAQLYAEQDALATKLNSY